MERHVNNVASLALLVQNWNFRLFGGIFVAEIPIQLMPLYTKHLIVQCSQIKE